MMRSWSLVVALLAVGCASAASSLRFEVRPEPGSPPAAAVLANGQLTIRLRHPNQQTATDLANFVAGRLNQALERGLAPEDISTRKVEDGVAVFAAEEKIATANATAARLAGQPAEGLAATWAEFLRRALSSDWVAVPADLVQVPLGETISLIVRGRPTGVAPTVAVAAEGLVRVEGPGTERLLRLTGQAVGATTLTLGLGAARLTLPLEILRRAGTLVGPVTARVAGPANRSELAAAIQSELLGAARLEPGARLTFRLPDQLRPPATGERRTVPVDVALEGAGYLPLRTVVPVTVSGEVWADQPADWLLVSNEPERVKSSQLLLRGPLPTGETTRLLYHHQTAVATPLTYELRLLNPTDRPARIWVRDASGGPSRYAEAAGHRAAVRYWQEKLAGEGWVLCLPPRSAWTINGARTPAEEVFSGLSDFRPLEGDGLELQFVATLGEPQLGPRALGGEPTAPPHDMFRFRQPDKRASYVYEPGGMYAFMNVGREPVASIAGPVLLGNYGVVYTLELEFRNSRPLAQRFELVFSADGGMALGTIIIDGRLYETGLVRGAEQERLLDFALQPGESRRLTIRILPESASNYPLRLVGRPYTPGWSGKGKP